MAVLSGFYALGTGVSNLGVFTEATGYTRPAVNLTGTVLSGLTQAVPQITGPTGPVGGSLTRGAIFDSITGGTCLCYWDWILPTAVPANFLTVTVSMVFNTYLQTALNMALIGGPGTTGSMIDAGAQIGTVNGNPLIAATRLTIVAGGSLAVHLGAGSQFNGADVLAALNFSSLASGNILNGITALPGGANSAATPVLWAFMNRVTTVGSAADSVSLPNTTVAPIGTIMTITNAAATNAMGVFPDTGSSINIALANVVLSIPAGKSAMFFRTGSLNWFAIVSA